MNVLLGGSGLLFGLELDVFGVAPFDDKVYELGSSIDLLTVGGLDVGGEGAEAAGDGVRWEEMEGGALGGGGGGAAAGEACPAARIAACMAMLWNPLLLECWVEVGGRGGGGGAEEREGPLIGGLGADDGGGGGAAGGGGTEVGGGGAELGGGGGT